MPNRNECRTRGPERPPYLLEGDFFVKFRSLLSAACWVCGLAGLAAAETPDPNAAHTDSLNRAVLWNDVVRFATLSRVDDVAFTAAGRNIVTPVDIVWALADSTHDLVAVAARPITGTAEAGEEMGRRGAQLLRAPVALHVGMSGSFVLEKSGRLVVFRGGAVVDSIALATTASAPRDVFVSATGLVYILTTTDVRVFADPPGAAPLWTIALPPALVPAVACAVSARGEVFVAGEGKTALAVYDLDATGTYRKLRQATRVALGVDRVAGLTLLPALLLPIEGREGWVSEDRYVLLSDRGKRMLVTLDVPALHVVGRADLAVETPGLVPGRLDVSNRGQIALADAATGQAYSLPTRILASTLAGAPIRWRQIGTLSPPTDAPGPAADSSHSVVNPGRKP